MTKVKIKAKVVKKKVRFALIRRIGRKIKYAASAIYNNIIKPVTSALYSLLIIRVILWIVATMLLIYSFFEFVPKKAYVSYNGNATVLPSISSRQCIAEMQSVAFCLSDFESLTLLCTSANINGQHLIGREYEDGSYDENVEIFIKARSDKSGIMFYQGNSGYDEFKHRITTVGSNEGFVNANITEFDPKFGYYPYVSIECSNRSEIYSNSDLYAVFYDVDIYYCDDDGNNNMISLTDHYNFEEGIDIEMDAVFLDYSFVAIINGKCNYYSVYDYYDHDELQGKLTFTDCNSISFRTTGDLELNYTKDSTVYELNNQDLDLQSRSSLTSRVTLDEDYIFDYMIDLEVFGHIYSGHVSGFDLFPNFFEWCVTNIYVIPMTIFTSILSAVVVFSKDKNKKK